MDALRQLCDMDWQQAFRNGGLDPKPIPDGRLKKVTRPADVDPAAGIVKIRAGDKPRIFGIRSGNTYSVLWFDREHVIDP